MHRICKSYFNGLPELFSSNTSKIDRLIAAVKVLSFATLVLPFVMGIIYGCTLDGDFAVFFPNQNSTVKKTDETVSKIINPPTPEEIRSDLIEIILSKNELINLGTQADALIDEFNKFKNGSLDALTHPHLDAKDAVRLYLDRKANFLINVSNNHVYDDSLKRLLVLYRAPVGIETFLGLIEWLPDVRIPNEYSSIEQMIVNAIQAINEPELSDERYKAYRATFIAEAYEEYKKAPSPDNFNNLMEFISHQLDKIELSFLADIYQKRAWDKFSYFVKGLFPLNRAEPVLESLIENVLKAIKHAPSYQPKLDAVSVEARAKGIREAIHEYYKVYTNNVEEETNRLQYLHLMHKVEDLFTRENVQAFFQVFECHADCKTLGDIRRYFEGKANAQGNGPVLHYNNIESVQSFLDNVLVIVENHVIDPVTYQGTTSIRRKAIKTLLTEYELAFADYAQDNDLEKLQVAYAKLILGVATQYSPEDLASLVRFYNANRSISTFLEMERWMWGSSIHLLNLTDLQKVRTFITHAMENMASLDKLL
jgi:hypothetical protein